MISCLGYMKYYIVAKLLYICRYCTFMYIKKIFYLIMDKNDYKEFVNGRFLEMIQLTRLPIPYIESGTNLSSSNFYNILNGNRQASIQTMEKLGDLLGLPLIRIFDPSCNLIVHVVESETLKDLLKIVAQLEAESDSPKSIIKRNLLQSLLFNKPVSVSEVRAKCPKIGKKEFSSHEVAVALDALVNSGDLKVTRMPIIKEDGSQGVRIIKYYVRPDINKN